MKLSTSIFSLGVLLLCLWPKLSFAGIEKRETVQSAVNFAPLVEAAKVAGCSSIVVAVVWSTGLVLTAKIKKGSSQCGD